MTDWNEFKGAAKRIDDVDLPKLGAMIGVGEDELHAFIDTETSGSGFDKSGRPKMLFEPHVFYRNLPPKSAARTKAVRAGLAYAKWGAQPYPRDSYPRLIEAIAIDETAALKSASWGMAQVLGENFKAAGYPRVQDMVRAMMADEENHLLAAVNFIKANGIDVELRKIAALKRPTTAADCVPIVKPYNGPGYAKNNYHVKFAAAHNKWRGIPDTPLPAGEKPVVAKPKPVPAPNAALTRDTIEKAQQRLRDLGYFEVGNVDGKLGGRTKGAVSSFQGDHNLPLSGELDTKTLDLLMDVRTEKRKIASERATATKDEIKDLVPSVKTGDWLQKIGTGILVSFGLGGLGDGAVNFDALTSGFSKFKGLTETLLTISPWVVGLVVGGVVLYFGSKIVRDQVQAYREGRHV